MGALALAVGSAIAWGLSDFLGGLQSRRIPLLTVMVVAQATPLPALAIVVLAAGDPMPPAAAIAAAAGAGAAGALALSAFYRGLAIGTMSIVAPISATGAIVPVVVGLATGDRPSAVQVVGMGLAVIGVVLASREEARDGGGRPGRAGVVLALLAALGFGVFFVAMDAGADDGVFWALLSARSASVAMLVAAALVARPAGPPDRRTLLILLAVGCLDFTANACYAVASTEGLLSVVSVVGAMYPVTTVLLARFVLGERVRRVQGAGVVAALIGVALIAGGG